MQTQDDTAPPEIDTDSFEPDAGISSAPAIPPHLYTRCPHCGTAFRVTVAQLRAGRGGAWCRECRNSFNILDALAETAAEAGAQPPPPVKPPALGRLEAVSSPLDDRSASDPGKPLLGLTSQARRVPAPADESSAAGRYAGAWRFGWALGALALAGLWDWQILHFEGANLASNERARPWLDKACWVLRCDLPPFRAPERIRIVERALHPAPGDIDGYEFVLVLSNQAALPQPFPDIGLTLAANAGVAFASRVFRAQEYLEGGSSATMETGKLYEVHLLLARPGRDIGSFSFELL
jgi:predicted Zn finger-like uncharacterized protein